jgi:hypothetical protein
METGKQPARWAGGSLRKARVLLVGERNPLEQLLLGGLVPEVAKESRSLTIECDAPAVPILRASFPAAEIFARGALKPDMVEERRIQTWSSLGDLAGRFRAAAGSFPNKPALLTADPTRVAELRAEYRAAFPDRFLVGLAWRHKRDGDSRSSALADWLPLLDRPDLGVVALFPGNAELELAQFAADSERDLIHDRRLDFSRDFGDYAAQVQACDAVVAIEDLAGVLAGAMGRPTLKLRREVDHWWWGAGDGANIWCPTLQSLTVNGPVDDQIVAQVLEFVDRVRAKA